MFTLHWWLALGGVFLLGLQTSISPCPLATNIAAISYIARGSEKTSRVIVSGLLYTLGRTIAYLLLAILILSTLFAGGESIMLFLQTQIHGYLGPILILIGLMLLGWLSLNLGGLSGVRMQKIADTFGIWSAFPLGALFAMAFCPTSVATFLATLTLASQFQSNVIFPVVFGMGTAVPVLIFAGVIALNVQMLGKVFSVIGNIDYWMRTTTGTIFILLGIWFSLKYVYEV